MMTPMEPKLFKPWLQPVRNVWPALVLAPVLVATLGATFTHASSEEKSDEDLLWEYETTFYQKRGTGDLSYYVSLSDPDYAVWAPTWPAPNGYAELVEAATTLQGKMAGEKISIERKLIRINAARNVGLVFYSSHRTAQPGGAPADDRFDTIHVWVKGDDGWRLMGGMARAAATKP